MLISQILCTIPGFDHYCTANSTSVPLITTNQNKWLLDLPVFRLDIFPGDGAKAVVEACPKSAARMRHFLKSGFCSVGGSLLTSVAWQLYGTRCQNHFINIKIWRAYVALSWFYIQMSGFKLRELRTATLQTGGTITTLSTHLSHSVINLFYSATHLSYSATYLSYSATHLSHSATHLSSLLLSHPSLLLV